VGDKGRSRKALKYKALTIEIQFMFNVKTKMTPVIVGATGTISKSFIKYLKNTTAKHDIKQLQRPAIMNTAHMLRKVGYTNVKVQNLCYEK
jgi:hypothetical protein